jgi:hypothetical protein
MIEVLVSIRTLGISKLSQLLVQLPFREVKNSIKFTFGEFTQLNSSLASRMISQLILTDLLSPFFSEGNAPLSIIIS